MDADHHSVTRAHRLLAAVGKHVQRALLSCGNRGEVKCGANQGRNDGENGPSTHGYGDRITRQGAGEARTPDNCEVQRKARSLDGIARRPPWVVARLVAGISCLMFTRTFRGLPIAFLFLLMASGAWSQSRDSVQPTTLSAAQIVEQMQRHNQLRNQELKHYKSVRLYAVEYKGFSKTITAKMEVEVEYEAALGKSFRIVSQSGSNFLCEKVLKRAVDSEKAAAEDKGSSALTAANYRFRLLGSESLEGRPAYILDVEPLTASKFLYRGKVWVDEADFALARIEAEPAKNPSFWISRTLIRHRNAKMGDFWLPKENRSETKVRIGGTAVLTIDYGTYQVAPEGTGRSVGLASKPYFAAPKQQCGDGLTLLTGCR